MDRKFTQLLSSDKVISDFYGAKLELLNLVKLDINDYNFNKVLVKFSFLVDYCIKMNNSKSGNDYIQLVEIMKPYLMNKISSMTKDDPHYSVLRMLEAEMDENKHDARNQKNILKISRGLIDKLLPEIKEKNNVFLSDYDRIVASSGIRRLQDKAQVYPLEKHDFVRSRLTHSHEVASISELVLDLLYKLKVKKIDKKNFEEKQKLQDNINNMKIVLRSASLIHDIGNPPFGHFGEDAIKSYYTTLFSSKREFSGINDGNYRIDSLNKEMKLDFTCYDGNAQGLRVVTKLQQYKNTPLNLSSSILGAIIKYPFAVSMGQKKCKFGYFYSEKDIISQLRENGVYIDDYMNPLAYILEVSDDIANFVSDFEDAVKKGIINYEIINRLFKQNSSQDAEIRKMIEKFESIFAENYKVEDGFERTMNQVISGIKKSMIDDVANHLNEMEILGDFASGIEVSNKKDLIMKTKLHSVYNYLKSNIFDDYVYKNKDIMKSEVKGYKIIQDVLEELTVAVLELKIEKKDGKLLLPKIENTAYKKYKKIFNLISPNFIEVYKNEITNHHLTTDDEVYFRLRLVTDFVSGMTDSYIEEFHKDINI